MTHGIAGLRPSARKRLTAMAAAIGMIATGVAFGQIPEPRLKFEVASIRRAPDLRSALESGNPPSPAS
jgi:hypothetical protein